VRVGPVEIERRPCDDSGVCSSLVLVVDDYAGFRRLARRVLERAGFRVAEAANGAEAVAAAERLQPDLVLLDIQLPDVDGFAVARSLADSSYPAPVVLTSTREAAEYGDRIDRSGAIAFLPKTEFSGAALRALLTQT
jgi:CheY-like chemotaxis protein